MREFSLFLHGVAIGNGEGSAVVQNSSDHYSSNNKTLRISHRQGYLQSL